MLILSLEGFLNFMARVLDRSCHRRMGIIIPESVRGFRIRWTLVDLVTVAGDIGLSGGDLEITQDHGGETKIGLVRVETNRLGGAEILRMAKDGHTRLLPIEVAVHLHPAWPGAIAIDPGLALAGEVIVGKG